MRKTVCLMLMLMLLCGCAAEETFETVSDDAAQSVMAPVGSLRLSLPEHASTPVINSEDGGKLYLCQGYTITEQVLQGGDIAGSVRAVCGFEMDALTVIQTRDGDIRRYEWVWSAVGEAGDQLGRAVLLDDGAYHYCVCVMADAADVGVLQPEWDSIFNAIDLNL